ncbi:MAG: winged helix-turn-helix domain-containing protein [Thermoprotei archaeon]
MEDRKTYLRILRSPARRAILIYLAENGPCRFMDIKKGTGLSTGVIYHHIRSLEGFVVQGGDRTYRLTEGGMRLVSSLNTGSLQIQNQDGDQVVEGLNDLLLEFYPTLIRSISYLSLTPLYRRLNTPLLQVAVAIAAIEFVLLVTSHISPFYSPVIGFYGLSVRGALISFVTAYIFLRLLRWVLTWNGVNRKDITNVPIKQRLARLVDPEFLSLFSLGFAITYISFVADGIPLVGEGISTLLFFWGYIAIASAVSYTSGLEFIPSLLLPFSMNMFTSLVDQILFEGYLQPLGLGFNLGMGALGILVAAWADRSMKSAFGRRLSSNSSG